LRSIFDLRSFKPTPLHLSYAFNAIWTLIMMMTLFTSIKRLLVDIRLWENVNPIPIVENGDFFQIISHSTRPTSTHVCPIINFQCSVFLKNYSKRLFTIFSSLLSKVMFFENFIKFSRKNIFCAKLLKIL